MATNPKLAVLLLAHGSPESAKDVPEFLKRITGGRPMPDQVVAEVKHRYQLIGRSPLTEITLQQGRSVQKLTGLPTYVGMRNWKPFVGDVVAEMARAGVEKAITICLAPQNSRTSVGLYRQSLGTPPFAVDFVENWHDHPLLIQAFAEKLAAGWKTACAEECKRVPILFTAHSVPTRTIEEGDPYEAQAKETAAMVAMQVPSISIDDWSFAFQSQGMSGGEWLGPTVESTIDQLAGEGHRAVFLQPIGFVCDHVEVLYDIDIAFKEHAAKRGMRLRRAESLNDSQIFAAAVADVVRSRMEPEKRSELVKIG